MKNILIIFGLLLTLLTADAQLFAPDKKKHFLVGTEIGFAASSITVNKKPIVGFAWSVGLTTVIGGSKELIYDKWMGKGTPEWKDFGCTVLGGVTGFAIVRGFYGICELIDRRQYRRLHPISK